MKRLSVWIIAALLVACCTPEPATGVEPAGDATVPTQSESTPEVQMQDESNAGADAGMARIVKTEAEWRAQLTPEQFYITRQAGTERPGTGEYLHNKQKGSYRCVCCDLELFSSDTKYDSHCGWPSFYKTAAGDRVRYIEDVSHGMIRTEVRCARCDAHLGHVFDDGPQEFTGQRYCMNSVALRFVPDEDGEQKN
jgi:peptide-methionine (R)-S-oxide reductase